MAELGSLLDSSDKVASVVGAVAGVAALWVAVRAGARRRNRPDTRVGELLTAQLGDAGRHRYRFFGEHVPALTDLYVRTRATLGGPAEGDRPRTVQATRILTTHRHAVLLGDAGAGKSTFLVAVASDFASRARRRRGTGEIAIVLPATDLVGRRLPEALAQAVRRDLSVDLPAEMFERPPAGGSTWRVLIDGLDEVVAARDRDDVLWRIRTLLVDPGPYRFVLTCRPLAAPELAELHGPTVGMYDLRPFDRRELDEFAHRWFTARFPHDQRRADRTAGRFLARVAGARLGPVARVPLLATIAALVYESESERTLPSSRAALYDRFVAHLLDGRGSLERFREAAEPELLSRGTEGAAVAAWLCSDIHRHVGHLLQACGVQRLTDPDVNLTTVAADWIEAHAAHGLGPNRDRLLRDLLLTTGVCTLHRGRVVFAHQSFAEYFAADAGDATFDEATWKAHAVDSATRSFAAFAAARRPEPDSLIVGLLDQNEPNAAGDLLADGIPVRPETRKRIIDRLLQQVTDETDQAPEALRILGELSIDADVLTQLAALTKDVDLSSWTRALVADRVADIDLVTGRALLRDVADGADDVVRAWIADTLRERGSRVDLDPPLPFSSTTVSAQRRPLSVLAKLELKKRLADTRATAAELEAAAYQLALDGDLTPLRAIAEAAGIDPYDRVQLAGALADAGDPALLRSLAGSSAGTSQAMYACAVALFERDDPFSGAALREVVKCHPDLPMAYGAAARCADLGDLTPLAQLARGPGGIHVRLAAARRLTALGNPDALRWLLTEALEPILEADILAGLIEAGRVELAPRLEHLLRRHRFRIYKEVNLRCVLAASGDKRSWRILRRWTRWRSDSHSSIEAAIALTALGDPYGVDTLRRTAANPRLRRRPRLQAAVGLAQLDPFIGRQVLDRLAASESPHALRLRAAMVAVGILDHAGPLARLALDETVAAGERTIAIEVLSNRYDQALLASLTSLATDDTTPATVRAAATSLLPDVEARAVLTSIATDAADPTARVGAIIKLAFMDRRTASTLFGQLLRDQRIGRLRRWQLAVMSGAPLPEADAETIADRLGGPDIHTARWLRNFLVLSIRQPEHVLGPFKD